MDAVVPGYHLVWYNGTVGYDVKHFAVVPGYHLVWYNLQLSQYHA